VDSKTGDLAMAIVNLIVVSATFVVGVGLGMVVLQLARRVSTFESWLREFSEDLRGTLGEELRLAGTAEGVGLDSISTDSSTFDYSELFNDTGDLSIVLNDGRTWLSVHRDRLRRRLLRSGCRTSIYLIHPDSKMVEVLARKGSVETSIIQGRIAESVQLVKECVSGNGHVEVLGHFLFNPFSLVLGPSGAVVTPYFLSRGGRMTPSFLFAPRPQGDGMYEALLVDVEGLRKDCLPLLPADGNVESISRVRGLRPV
jgi:hypothetical protein